ncbi:MAG: pyrroloquinoline quinone biosynthesis protein PqqB [Candidatus Velthaea sp.]
MIVRVLGSAAGGGVPQWNCGCANCEAARHGRAPVRTQSSVAVSSDGERWLLLNISPDIAAQVESYAPLQPRSLRGSPIAAIALTDANIDHIGGLAVIRQASEAGIIVHSTAVVREIALTQQAFARFSESPHRWKAFEANAEPIAAADGADPAGADLILRAYAATGTTPGYAGRREVPGAVTAYTVRARAGGKTLCFAPVYAAVDDALREAIASADVSFLDGSFYDDDDMIVQGLGDKRASDLGHLPLHGAGGTMDQLGSVRSRRLLTHLNNTNPVLDPNSSAAREIAKAGFELAHDGLELIL